MYKSIADNWGNSSVKDNFNFDQLQRFLDLKLLDSEKIIFQHIDEHSVNDLDLNEVFKVIDNTSSCIGQQFLYYRFRNIFIKEVFENYNKLTNLFLRDIEISIKLKFILTSLSSNDSVIELLEEKNIKTPKHIFLIYFMTFNSLFFLFLGFVNSFFLLFLIPIFLINTFIHYKFKWEITRYTNSISELGKAYGVARKILNEQIIINHFNDLNFIEVLRPIIFKTKIIASESRLGNELNIAFWLFVELLKILFNIESIVFYSFIHSIITKRESIKELCFFIGEIDSSLSIASFMFENTDICIPDFVKNKMLTVQNIKHPLINDCVGNVLNIKDESMILTGSNMSGKTSFIRTIAVNALIAQTLNFCFAETYQSNFVKILTSIKNSDDTLTGTSYYLQEVKRLKNIIDEAEKEVHCLIVIDEIFKGTNTNERIKGASEILKYINKFKHRVLITTHDLELLDLLNKYSYQAFYFNEDVENNELSFSYKLKVGKLNNTNALKILAFNNYPKEIIENLNIA